MSWFLKNRDSITLLIAVVGFLTSSIMAFQKYFQGRRCLKLEVIDYRQIPEQKRISQFFILFHNKSSMPLFISKVSLKCLGGVNNEFYCDCELEPKMIKSKTKSDTIMSTIKSVDMPMRIDAFGMRSEYFEFINSGDAPLVPKVVVTFRVYTNRGVMKKSLMLGEKAQYLHLRR